MVFPCSRAPATGVGRPYVYNGGRKPLQEPAGRYRVGIDEGHGEAALGPCAVGHPMTTDGQKWFVAERTRALAQMPLSRPDPKDPSCFGSSTVAHPGDAA
jgi:hypothetical protein